MNYTGTTLAIPLIPRIKKRIAHRKLRCGKPISRLTNKTKNEVKTKKHLVNEAARLMKQVTPCADNAEAAQHAMEALQDILLDSDEDYDSDELYIEDKINKSHDKINKSQDKILEKQNSPIHHQMLENELTLDNKPIHSDNASDTSDTSDTEYKEALKKCECNQDECNQDDELDIIDSEFAIIE
jgi:hypothetical protein